MAAWMWFPGRAGAAVLMVVALSACTSSREVRQAVAGIENGTGAESLHRQERIALGPVTLAMVRGLVRLTDEADGEDLAILRAIRRVEVVTYEVVGGAVPEGELLGGLEARLADQGWQRVVRTRDVDERVWLFARADRRARIDGLFVVSLDGDELEVVYLRGDVERILEASDASLASLGSDFG